MAEFRPGTPEQTAFLEELVGNGLLVESGVPGVFGRNSTFEDVRVRVDALITRTAAPDGPEALRSLVSSSVPFVVFDVERILSRADVRSAEGRDRALVDSLEFQHDPEGRHRVTFTKQLRTPQLLEQA